MEALKDCDCNTKYFHLSIVIRRKQNIIETLQDENEVWVMDVEQIKTMVWNYWSNLFREEALNAPRKQRLCDYFPRISKDEWCTVNLPFASSEVHVSLMDMKPYKALVSDGFQPIFYQGYWEVVSPKPDFDGDKSFGES